LYNRALKAGEINQIFKNNTPKAVSNALVGYWPLDGNLNDISGNNHNGLQYTILGSMVSAPDGRLFFDEVNTGKIKIMKDDKVLTKPFATISDYHTGWEQGLLGLALDPKFDQNRFVYLYYTSKDSSTGEPFNRVVRFTDNDNIGTNMVVILDRIPATKLGYHNGGAMAFGPDDKLYITVGDAYNDVTAQDTSALTGKVLRINRDGSIPQDNPYMTPMPSLIPFNGLVAFFNSLSCYITSCHTPVYNIGHRNMYGIAFDNNGFGIVTEAGDTNYDKINDIKKGGNYGWPTMQPANLPPELSNNSSIKPLRTYFEGITPTQAIYYDKDKIRQLNGKFLFGTYRGDIYALKIDKQTNEVIEEEKIRLLHYPENRIAVPVIGIAESRDGSVYYGAYSIYKLESVDASNKKQYIFPVEVNSKDSMIRGLQIDLDKKAMVLDVHAYSNNDNYLSPSVSVKIPKRILDGIFEVSSTNIEQKTRLENVARQNAVVNYAIDEFTSPDYTIINIRLKSDVDSKLSINGTSAIS